MFGVVFDLEVDSPHVSQLDESVGEEAVLSSVEWSSVVVTSSSLEHVSVVGIEGHEGVRHLREIKSSVSVSVVSLQEKVDFIVGWVHTDASKSVSDFMLADNAISVSIVQVEQVEEVEVGFQSQRGLCRLKLSFEFNVFLEGSDKFVFVVEAEDWLSRWGRVSDRGSDWGLSHWGSSYWRGSSDWGCEGDVSRGGWSHWGSSFEWRGSGKNWVSSGWGNASSESWLDNDGWGSTRSQIFSEFGV